ncbi:MAG: ATP-binding protein [Motiliproteus sp.]
MKLSSSIRQLGIRQRVLILALLPMLMITFTLSAYMINSRLNSERENLFLNSQTLLNYLATGAELGMFSRNETTLKLLAKAPLQRSEISDVIFIDTKGEVVYRSTDISIPEQSLPLTPSPSNTVPQTLGQLWLLRAPVLVSGDSIDDFPEPLDTAETIAEPEVIGRVILLINEDDLKQTQQGILFRGLLITLIGLSLTIWLALAIGRSITHPIQGIIETIHRLGQEDLDARIAVKNKGEIGELEKGINNLADKVQRTRLRLQDQVDEATRGLWLTMERLERKNIALDRAKKHAEQANQSKDQFLARMSHELRTPLTSVMGFIQLLQKTTLNKEQKEYSSIVSRTSTLLLSLIDDILDFSKLQSDAISIEKIPFNLEECIEDTLAMQAAAANEKGLNLYFISDPKLPERILGDPTRIRQIISNLVSNAVKFTASGNVTVTLECSQQHSSVALKLSVKDTGIGIDADKMSLLFKPFTQADSSITRRFGGTGLGLVITKHLVELMGGNILLNSQNGRGTQVDINFCFEFEPQTKPAVNLPDSKVLVFSRSKEALMEIGNALAKWNLTIIPVSTQRQLLKQLKTMGRHLDTVVVDLPNASLQQHYQRLLLKSIRHRYSGRLIMILPKEALLSNSDKQCLPLPASIKLLPRPLSRPQLLEALLETNLVNTELATTGNQKACSQSLQNLNVLVAEDNDFNRLLLRKILEQAGANLTLAINGEQALAHAREKRFDCILMDVHMPLMDGIEASCKIRQLPAPFNQPPILALTANVIANEELKLKQAGVDTTLFKPINESIVISHIQKAAKITVRSTTEDESVKPRLSDYGISDRALHSELNSQIVAIHRAYQNKDVTAMRDHSHQLMGLAGLLDLVELEAATNAFNHAVKTTTGKEIWQSLWRLKRVIAAAGQ